ncbi:SDR family oxidoreductase [Nocardia sp. CA-128927]|uniref:SDR family oxidoreductase n=1 Tax=Nocardia sp. CA-128927 TaxID=3239975 RepID=UPI003D9955EF
MPLLEAAGQGAIVNLSSTPADFVLGRYAAVGVSKAAQDALTRYLAVDLGPANIRVNTVSASLVDNYALDYWTDAAQRRQIAVAGTPLGMMPSDDDVAEAVVFLASPSAKCISGTKLVVDGGMSLRLAGLPQQPGRPAWTRGLSSRPHSTASDRAVAVVGMGVVLPGANTPEEFWGVLSQEHNTFGEPESFDLAPWFSDDHTAEDKTYVRTAGFIRNFIPHPALAIELEQGRWSHDDHTTVLLRHCLLQARDTMTHTAADRYGCYVGSWSGGSLAMEESILAAAGAAGTANRHRERVQALLAEHYPHSLARPRVAFPDMMVRNAFADLLPPDSDWLAPDTACSSSLYAIDLAVKSLLADDCDIAFCGGANITTRRDLVLFAKLKGLSPNGEIRAFDANSQGVLFSDAAAMLALKRLDRAVADGDEILGVLAGFGGSTDGQGSTVAPDVLGQRLAFERARTVNTTDASAVDWIVAHGTGTPIGDLIELQTMTELAGDRGLLATSNKPLVGHAGWAAGAVSVVHALLALRNETIPGERYLTALPADAPVGNVRVPVEETPWPARPERSRVAGVTGFGLGGTNAHLLVRDLGGNPPAANPPTGTDDIVVVGWRAHLPGTPDPDRVRHWLRTGSDGPQRSFGEQYPLPPFRELRMPPVAARTIDRTQLMAVAVVDQFVAEHGELWERHRDRTGVITGHMGPTRSMVEYTIRAGATDLVQTLSQDNGADLDDTETLLAYLAELTTRLPASNEESIPGQQPNIISARVANRFHLHGMTMALESGHSSTQAALHVAGRYLATGELDVALVLGINGNSTPVMAQLTGIPHEQLAEGAVLLALTRKSLATEQGWPILARIHTSAHRPDQPRRTPETWWGKRDGEPSYLGADGALAVLRALESGLAEVDIDSPDSGPHVTVYPTTVAVSPSSTSPPRSVAVLRRRNAIPTSAPLPAIPRSGIVLTDSAALAAALAHAANEAGAVVLCTDPAAAGTSAIVVGTLIDETAAETVLAHLEGASPNLRLVASIRDTAEQWPAPPAPALVALQEWALLVIKRLGERVQTGSVAALLLDPLAGHTIHPHLTLLTGFLRSLALELPCRTFAVVTDATLEAGLDQLTAESTAQRDRSIVLYRSGLRYVEQTCPAPLPPAGLGRTLAVDRDSVVVATGGGRGVTSVVLTALAKQSRPTLWLLGTTALDNLPTQLLDTPDDGLTAARTAYLAAQRAAGGDSIAELNRQFDALLRVREITVTLRRLRQLCGPDRVHYLVCDVGDREQVQLAAKTIGADGARVDLLIHGAGRIRSAAVAGKSLAEFREVCAAKVIGYHNLKDAFTDPPPRQWCNFSSVSGLFGCAGDTDYSPANEYLAAASRYENLAHNTGEFTIGWGLWSQTGMAHDEIDHLSRQYGITGVGNDEGARLFLAELATPRPPEPTSIYGVHQGWSHGLGHRGDSAATTSSNYDRRTTLLGDAVHRSSNTANWTWQAEPDRDGYLREHLIDGRASVPAVMMLAMAAEAAGGLCMDAQPIGFTDFQIQAPIFADPDGRPPLCRIQAEMSGPQRVRVRILSDMVTADGRILSHDRLHCQTDVLLGAPLVAPHWAGRSAPRGVPLADDVSMRPDIPVQLSGVWRTLHALTVDESGAYACWLPRAESDGVFANLLIPALLIDSMFRLLIREGPARVRMIVPLSVDRIDLYTAATDVELAHEYPTGLDLYYDETSDEIVAVSPTSRVLIRVTGLKVHTVKSLPVPISYPSWHPSQRS